MASLEPDKEKIMALTMEKKGNVSRAFIRNAQASIQALPAYARKALEKESFRFVAGSKLYGLHAGLTQHKTATGFHAPALRTIFLAKHRYSPAYARWMNSRSAIGTVFHETGHFIDLFMKGTGHHPDGYRSNRMDFVVAWLKDIQNMRDTGFSEFHRRYDATRKKPDGTIDTVKVERLKYHLEKKFFDEISGWNEVYAELWAQFNGQSQSMPPGFKDLFPSCAKLVDQDMRDMALQAILNNNAFSSKLLLKFA